jgi:hypothetical protein
VSGVDSLQHLSEQLEQAAARLRDGELDAQAAARLVEDCARIAGDAAAELDRRTRAAAAADDDPR